MLCRKEHRLCLREIRVQILALPLTLILSFSSLWTGAPHLQTHREDAWDPVWRRGCMWQPLSCPLLPVPKYSPVLKRMCEIDVGGIFPRGKPHSFFVVQFSIGESLYLNKITGNEKKTSVWTLKGPILLDIALKSRRVIVP